MVIITKQPKPWRVIKWYKSPTVNMIVLFLGFTKDMFNNKCASVFKSCSELKMLCGLQFITVYDVVNSCKIIMFKVICCNFFFLFLCISLLLKIWQLNQITEVFVLVGG